ncbi:MAG: LLM class flavin-dependent oxidoreductase [Chloroflexi bacterium]|nr:MAG: LLM class flavin-dependent oxidoreductase [Phototrophicales bacterium]RMF79693.1 MAG: LLM class flavin-dependent oxidoreductase [Chloroflexota bacterium]
MTKREISIGFQTDKSPAQYVALAQLVDRYDFDAVSVYSDLPFHPGFSALTLMAPHIKRARIGVAGVSPARISPIDIAAETALLAQLANAGIYLGLVRGGWLETHGIMPPAQPIQAIRETIDIVRHILSGNTGGYHGSVYHIGEYVRAQYPLPKDPIPILIGTWGKKLAALAGELADEVKIGGTANPDIIPVIRGYIAEGEHKAGRNDGTVGIVVGAVTVVDEDREQARQLVRREVAMYLPLVVKFDSTVEVEPELITRLESLADQGEYDVAGRLISDDLLQRFAFAGTPYDLIEHAERLFDAGASRIEFGTPHGIKSEHGIVLLGEKVIPHFKDR